VTSQLVSTAPTRFRTYMENHAKQIYQNNVHFVFRWWFCRCNYSGMEQKILSDPEFCSYHKQQQMLMNISTLMGMPTNSVW